MGEGAGKEGGGGGGGGEDVSSAHSDLLLATQHRCAPHALWAVGHLLLLHVIFSIVFFALVLFVLHQKQVVLLLFHTRGKKCVSN